MPAVVTNPVHNPSLDQLNYWGALDDLPYSLDSSDIWSEADLWSLEVREAVFCGASLSASVISYSEARARSYAREKCVCTAVKRAQCRLLVTTSEKLHSGYVAAKLKAQAESSESLHVIVIKSAVAAAGARSGQSLCGSLRGWGWVERQL